MQDNTLIKVQDLSVEFPLSSKKKVHAVSDVSLEVKEHEVLALVGESGCGKSTLGKAMIQLIKPTAGEVSFKDAVITNMPAKAFRDYRRQMQIVFQDPYASLDPRMSVRDIIAEPLETYNVCATPKETTERVVELLEAVGLSADHLYRYAHQFSGGQRQRIGIARAIALNPSFIVCDEPVSALDVSVQNQILNLLKDLQERFGLTYLFISHDLSVVRFIANRVCVMFLGKLCELGDTETIYTNPLHPYTRFLLDAIPKADPHRRRKERMLLSGELPSPVDPPSGCRFHTRCPYATEKCRTQEPEMKPVEGRMVACHLYAE
ncbi:MAG: ATP-binding cassette domain-containing protein [Clostridia bacterium]|nr:ATP-binding cassette domain-containing protein [Clostridia bacterium]